MGVDSPPSSGPDLAAGQPQQRGRVAGPRVGDVGAVVGRPPAQVRAGGDVGDVEAADQLVGALEHPPGRRALPRVRPQQRPELTHRGGGAQVVPDDVPDRQADRAVRQREHVEPVATDLGAAAGRDVRGGDVEAGDLRDLRQQAALQGQGGGALGEEQPDVVEREARATPQVRGRHHRVGGEALGGDEGQHAEDAVARAQRDHHRAAEAEPAQQVELGGRRPGRETGHVDGEGRGDETRTAGQRLRDGGRAREPADVLVGERARGLLVVRVGGDQVDAVEPAAVVGDRDEPPGGQRGDRDVAEGVHRVVVLEVLRELVADQGQQVEPGRRLRAARRSRGPARARTPRGR